MEREFDIVEGELRSERAKAIITLVITTAATIANMYGFAVDAEAWVNVCLCILNAVLIGYTWWKNQNITVAAVCGQHVLDEIKGKK